MTNYNDDGNSIEYVYTRMKCEGLDYCFRMYSTFEEVDDEHFHKLRKAYVKAANDLESYITTKFNSQYE